MCIRFKPKSSGLLQMIFGACALVSAGLSTVSAQTNVDTTSVEPRPVVSLRPNADAMTLTRARSFDGDLRSLPSTRPPFAEVPEREPPHVVRTELPAGSVLREPARGPVITAPAPAPIASFDGLDFANFGAGRPPDTNGDVGPNHFIQSVNSSIGIYDKVTGTRLVGVSLNTFMRQGNFGNLCDTNNFGDPVVLYDTFEDRWIITDFAFTLDAGNNVINPPGMFQCFAASKTNDPVTGGWNYYSFNTTGGLGDYGKFGIWPDGLYSTFNMFNYASGGGFQNVRVYALNKAQMYAGYPTVQIVSFDLPPAEFTVLPANSRLQTGTPPVGTPNLYSVVWRFINVISVYKFKVDWNNISLSSFTGPFDSVSPTSWGSAPSTVPAQGGNANDTLQPRLMSQNQYTNIGGVESLWNTHTVLGGASQASPRYYQVNVTGGAVGASTTQAFTHSPDATINRYIPSIAVNRVGDMALVYSASSATLPPAIRYAGRLATDPVNTLPQTETSLIDGPGAQNTSNRWGDYASMTLDPDGCTFWMTTEYYGAVGGNWLTRIGSFKFPSCTNVGAPGTLSGTVTLSPGGSPISGATVTLGTRTAVTNGSGVYSFSNLPAGTYHGEIASKVGFNDSSVANNLAITSGGTTTQNFTLTQAAATACLVDSSQADFQAGIASALDLTTSPGSVTLTQAPVTDQQNSTLGTSGVGITITTWGGQTFTPAISGTLVSAEINLFCAGCTGTTPTLTLSVRATSAGLPTGADLATATITGFSSGAAVNYTGAFGVPPALVAGTTYALVIRPTANPSVGTYALTRSGTSTAGANVYAGGARITGATSGTVWSTPLTGGVSTDAGFRTVMQVGYTLSGNLLSANKFTNTAPDFTPYWTSIAFTGTTPASTTIRFQAAASNEPFGPFNFVGPDGTASTFFTSGASLTRFDGFRYLKYKALLDTTVTTATPTLADVTVCYENRLGGNAALQGLQLGNVTIPATIAGANRITHVNFSQSYVNPPVVIVQSSDENADPAALRITNVTRNGFDVLQVESPGCAGCTALGGTAQVHWLAAAPGSYRLTQNLRSALRLQRGGSTPDAPAPGALLKVGTINTSTSQRSTSVGGFASWPAPGWQTVSFPPGEAFATPPVVLSTIQSWNNEGNNLGGPAAVLSGTSQVWTTLVSNNVTTSGFDIAIESSEVDDDDVPTPGLNTTETIGYVAIEKPVSMQLVQLGSASFTGLATGFSSTTDACTLTDLPFPPTAPLVAANLRGFAAKQSRIDSDGGWLRRCVLSTPAANTVRMTVRVDEDADIDAERSHATAENIGVAIFGGDFISSPISLAKVETRINGTQLDVNFATATEVGHLGFRVWGRNNPDDPWVALHGELIFSKALDSMKHVAYQHSVPVPADGLREIRLEDIDLLGRSRFSSAQSINASVGAASLTPTLNWSAIRQANAATPVRQLRTVGANKVLAQVERSGIQRLTFADLQAAGWATTNDLAAEIAVLDANQPVTRHVECPGATFGPGCTIEFLGVARESLYGKVNSYSILRDKENARSVNVGGLADGNGALNVMATEFVAAPNRAYSFSAPANDPWYDERILATTTPVSIDRSFGFVDRAPGAVSVDVDVWGGVDFAGNDPDHSVSILVNGQMLRSERFDGLKARRLQLEIPESLLSQTNTLTVRLNADTGFDADVVLLDGFTVRYPRYTKASNGELAFGQVTGVGGADELFSGSFESKIGFALSNVLSPSVLWTQSGTQVHRDEIATSVQVDSGVTGLLLQEISKLTKPSLQAVALNNALDTSNADYLIVTHPLFEAELGPILALQQSRGYSVRVLRTDEIYAARSDFAPSPQAIREVIAEINPRFVLLVGGDTYDYHNYLGVGSQSYVPTFYRVADPIVRFAATDAMYVDSDNDGAPERALGRIPARTVAELRLAMDSIVRRGNAAAGKTLAVAGASSAAEHFDIHSRSLLSYLRQGQAKDFALVDEIGITAARSKASAGLAGAADWINYLGHSSPNRWAAQNLLDTSQLAGLSRLGNPAIVSQWGCWNNYFVLPDQDTMAHALMLRSNQLAAAVIGSTSLAEDASHMALGTHFFDLVEDGRLGDATNVPVNTLGEALRDAKIDLLRTSPSNVESNYSITLFGDPASVIRN